jgi:DNA-binding MarR family transcriptional regulator
MNTDELKFLLKLLGCENYRSSFGASIFKSFKSKDKLCQDLSDRELIDYSREIAAAKILPPGKALLKLDLAQIPIQEKELKLLEAISKASGKITPSQIKTPSLSTSEKEAILKTLGEKGFIQVETKRKKIKAEVWLTERGIKYLRDEYNPNKGVQPVISLDLLNNYIRFLRKTLRNDKSEQVPISEHTHSESTTKTKITISDEQILETIKKLDRELGTDNYLPIFHLRQKLQPPLSRDELDQALYRLQRNDKIEFSTLLDPTPYTPEQVDAGIKQNIGGSLFFIIVN